MFQTLIFAIFITMAIIMLIIRFKAIKKPTSVKKILLPPIGMSTGFIMFLYPPVHIPWTWAGLAFLAGAIFLAIPLIKTSHFQIVGKDVYLKPSKTFMFLLVFLLVIRLTLHSYLEQYISLYQTAGLFFIFAFGMLLPWRIAMFIQYKKFLQQIEQKHVH